MDAATRDRLLDLNRTFYSRCAAEFSATRRRPWLGWDRVLARLDSAAGHTILDLGCGNGRLADACARRFAARSWTYTGVDGSAELIAAAARRVADLRPAGYRLVRGDLFEAMDEPWSHESFGFVALFGVLHHVPGDAARRDLLRVAASRVAPGGLLAVSFWQWAGSDRLVARVAPPAEAGLAASDLGSGDALLRWGEGGDLRYCHACGPEEAADLVANLGLATVDSFQADGADGAMNLYHVLRRSGRVPRRPGVGGSKARGGSC